MFPDMLVPGDATGGPVDPELIDVVGGPLIGCGAVIPGCCITFPGPILEEAG